MNKKSSDPDAVWFVKKDLKDIMAYYEHPKNYLDYEKIYGTTHWVIALEEKYMQVVITADAAIYDLYIEVVAYGCTQKEYAEFLGCNINRVHRTYKNMLLLFVKAFYEPNQNTPSNDK